jgi:hypothetical protein
MKDAQRIAVGIGSFGLDSGFELLTSGLPASRRR